MVLKTGVKYKLNWRGDGVLVDLGWGGGNTDEELGFHKNV